MIFIIEDANKNLFDSMTQFISSIRIHYYLNPVIYNYAFRQVPSILLFLNFLLSSKSMNRKLSELDLSQTHFQTSSTFSATNSLLSPTSSTKACGSKFDSPKMFQRKPTFKTFQRREKKEPDQYVKITYVSPQKSGLFKKYASYGQNRTDLNSSIVTDNSSEFFGNEQTKKSFEPLSLFSDLKQSRSVLNEINNLKADNGFMTPKNRRNQLNWTSPNYLKKSSVRKLKTQEQAVANEETDFNSDFNFLNHIKQPTFGLYTSSRFSYCDSERRIQKNSSKELKQNYGHEKSFETLPFESRIKVVDHEMQIQKLRTECQKLKIQKNQMEDSSRIFLEQVKDLQQKLQIQTSQKNKAIEQSTALRQMLFQKEQQIKNLNAQIKTLEAINQAKKSDEHDENEHLKAMYFQLSQKLKYLNVENNILKKFLEQKKDYGFKIQRLQNFNKKLTSRNKFLTKALQQIEFEAKEQKEQIPTKKSGFPLNLQKNKFVQRKPVKNQNHCKTPNKKSGSMGLDNKVNRSSLVYSKTSYEMEGEDIFSISSNGSELELSFELSPEKNNWSKFNENSSIRQFKTKNTNNEQFLSYSSTN